MAVQWGGDSIIFQETICLPHTTQQGERMGKEGPRFSCSRHGMFRVFGTVHTLHIFKMDTFVFLSFFLFSERQVDAFHYVGRWPTFRDEIVTMSEILR
jgi:hypothetical protein